MAEEALALPDASRFDVLLTDISLPGMSGIELARTMLAQLPHIRIVFASGYGKIEAEKLGFEAAFLPKPYNMVKMRELLAEIAQRVKPVA
jgi:YesN/AraC family two-component response regulator